MSAIIKNVKEFNESANLYDIIYPITHERAVIDSNGTNLETKLGLLDELLEDKQNVIDDLSTIRTKANSALLPGDNISNLNNNSGFITNAVDNLVNYYLKNDTYTQEQVNNLIGAIQQFHFEIYPSTNSISTPASNVLYLIGPTGDGEDKYEEYVYSNNTFVKIGDTSIDLTNVVKHDIISSNGISSISYDEQEPVDEIENFYSSGPIYANVLSGQRITVTASTNATLYLFNFPDLNPNARTLLISGVNKVYWDNNTNAEVKVQFGSDTKDVDCTYKVHTVGYDTELENYYTKSEINTVLNTALTAYTTTINLNTLLAGKQDVINDLSTIRSGASAGATAYQLPDEGIPASDIASGVIPDISGKQNVIDAQHKLSADLVDDSNTTNKFVTPNERQAWNNKSDFSGSYNDLTDKPTIPTVPTNVSAFTNDVGYLTQHQDISGKEDRTPIVATSTTSGVLNTEVGKYYRIDVAVDTLAVTLPAMTDLTTVRTVVIYLTAGTTPAVTITSADNKNVYYQDGFEIEAGNTYEINALFNGAAWIVAGVKINTSNS